MLLFLAFYSSKNPEQNVTGSKKILNHKTVSNTGKKINILEWFQKDHMTLKTGVTADEISDLHHWIKLDFKVY